MNERELVARARELFSSRIGDDAAVIGSEVITTDMLVEDVDFTRAIALPLIARKSLAANLSDVAAMGAVPTYAVVSIGLPEWARDGIDSFLVSLRDAAKQWRVEIVGGDFSGADKLVISIAALGRIETRPLLRSGARAGDRVYVSRPIGGSAAGLALLQRNLDSLTFLQREFAQSAISRHVDPEPEVDLGPALGRISAVTACIDISDGLSTDLHHLCESSQCGAEIERERIPIFPGLLEAGPSLGIQIQDAVLHGGEEYALLFTASLRESDLSTRLKRPVYAIGKITAEREIVLKEDGVARALEARGWDHFNDAGRRR
ncbi:MAG TPA: thiamine-phosphate kinase [Thermoanaerobaculia bacterium]|jgi:thiamine-monophosphate kinase